MTSARLDRTVFRLSGEGVEDWLSSLITNEISGLMTFAALLTPQGKIIADFFIHKNIGLSFNGVEDGEQTLFLETPSKFAADLHKRLKMYKLRRPIEITTPLVYVTAIWDGHPRIFEALDQIDPRHPSLGLRRIVPKPSSNTNDDNYNAHRLSLGVADSQWDFETSKVFPADANMDLMNGVSFSKGCFVGQEVVSRMKRMTTVKKRMRGIIYEGQAKAGDHILSGERVIGDVLSTHGKSGMAMIRLDRLREAEDALTLNGGNVVVMKAVDGLDH